MDPPLFLEKKNLRLSLRYDFYIEAEFYGILCALCPTLTSLQITVYITVYKCPLQFSYVQ